MKTEKTKSKPSNKQEMNSRAKRFTLTHWHFTSFCLLAYDFFAVNIAYFFALWIRFDCQFSMIPQEYLSSWIAFAPFYTVFGLVAFRFLRLYHSLWEYASYNELTRVIFSSVVTGIFHVVFITVFVRRMPISYYVIGAGVQFFLVLFIRFAHRFINLERGKLARKSIHANRVMLIGAGSAGQMILRDLHKAKESNERVCCIIDDDKSKQGCFIDGVPIVGGRETILANVEKYKIQKIFLAIPSASAAQRGEILNICKATTCELKNLPGMYQLVNGAVTAEAMKDVDVEDLLGREPIRVSLDEIFSLLSDKVILVTGGGGSIGSELCRQIAKNNPKQLIIFDIYENNAHAIQLELRDKYPSLNLEVLIGSVRDSKRVNQIFEKYRPDIVYHAAAHKHVPLMEDSPCESIKNNAAGTYNTAYAAMTHGCKRFVLISTDKAVNPTNIMGASKRICEMIVQSFARKIKEGKAHEIRPLDATGACECTELAFANTDFVAVRFGNVLGSNGSVVPRFKEQIARGGPVTVTHPDIIRYFMTIPEAVSLVLQAGAYAEGGEIFVLDMGSPVKIDTLARDLIRLSGLRPDIDIKISYIGLRPGEKLYEEKLMSEEGMRTTPNHLIHIGCPIPFDSDEFLTLFFDLIHAARCDREDEIRALIGEIVPTYQWAAEKAVI